MYFYVCRVCKAEEYHKTGGERRCTSCGGMLRLLGYKEPEKEVVES